MEEATLVSAKSYLNEFCKDIDFRESDDKEFLLMLGLEKIVKRYSGRKDDDCDWVKFFKSLAKRMGRPEEMWMDVYYDLFTFFDTRTNFDCYHDIILSIDRDEFMDEDEKEEKKRLIERMNKIAWKIFRKCIRDGGLILKYPV